MTGVADLLPVPCSIVVGLYRRGHAPIFTEVALTDAVHPGEPGKPDPLLADAMDALTRALAERLIEAGR